MHTTFKTSRQLYVEYKGAISIAELNKKTHNTNMNSSLSLYKSDLMKLAAGFIQDRARTEYSSILDGLLMNIMLSKLS